MEKPVDFEHNRPIRLALLISIGLHSLALWVVNSFLRDMRGEAVVRVELPAYRPTVARFLGPDGASMGSPQSPGVAEAGVAEKGYPFETFTDIDGTSPSGGVPRPNIENAFPLPGGKQEWHKGEAEETSTQSTMDRIADLALPGDLSSDIPFALDLVELDAERRQRTIALIDPTTKKLKKAYFHVPCWRNKPPDHNARELAEAASFMNYGFALPSRVPIETEIHYYRWGYRLTLDEMKKYPVFLLRYLGGDYNYLRDVKTLQTVAAYLANGGLAVVINGETLSQLQQELRRQGIDRVSLKTLELEHFAFHAFFDIARYYPGNPQCPGIGPTPALEADGRIVAVVGPRFTWERNCHSNEQFVNLIAFGLAQPSRLGGQYMVREVQ